MMTPPVGPINAVVTTGVLLSAFADLAAFTVVYQQRARYIVDRQRILDYALRAATFACAFVFVTSLLVALVLQHIPA